MVTYFNVFNERRPEIAPVPCLTPGCGASILQIDLGIAAAMLEFNAIRNRPEELSLRCDMCKTKSSYSKMQIESLTPESIRSLDLPDGYFWGLILLEIETATEAKERVFFGERILVKLDEQKADQWMGRLQSESQLAPSLKKGTFIHGYETDGYFVSDNCFHDGKWHYLPLEQPEKGTLDCGGFFLPKDPTQGKLQCGHITCRNPSCNHFFTLTYKSFMNAAALSKAESMVSDVIQHTHILTCLICGVSRVIDIQSYDNLYKL